MLLQQSVQHVIAQLCSLLTRLSVGQYCKQSIVLSNATIGQHVRHTIELFQSLLRAYETGILNYDDRLRDKAMETDRDFAIHLLQTIAASIKKPNKNLALHGFYDMALEEGLAIDTNFYRELVYNLEHAIHHMALIRVGVQEVSSIKLNADFGVAPSTLQYRKACAQ
ncbi:MAG: hypothetical protein ABIX01_16890 [Chitinophagaceae bacterium]